MESVVAVEKQNAATAFLIGPIHHVCKLLCDLWIFVVSVGIAFAAHP